MQRYDFMIFVYNLADSLFLGVLLIISCGWQITRDSFDKRKFIFFFPPIHFGCSVTVDYILDKHIGHEDNKEEVRGTHLCVRHCWCVWVCFCARARVCPCVWWFVPRLWSRCLAL